MTTTLEQLLEILIPVFSGSLPFAIFMGIMYSLNEPHRSPPVAIVEIVENEIEIEYIRLPSQEEIERSRATNLRE